MTSRRTIHLVYPHGSSISAPDSIGRELGRRLETRYAVEYHDWDSQGSIASNPGDVLIGHPHPVAGTCFRASVDSPNWSRRIMLCPFNHDPAQVGFLDPLIRRVDVYLAITGSYWFDSAGQSRLSHWLPKMVHMDMAIEPADFPSVRGSFNPAGRRRFLYIGHSGWQKNTGYLTELARLLPEVAFDWIGHGEPIPGLVSLGAMDFSTSEARSVVAEHDFLVTVGLFDANPTTILEAMGWGLLPICTPQSGYYGNPGILNIPAGDAEAAVQALQTLNHAAESELMAMQELNRRQIEQHFNWDRFAAQVKSEIESTVVRRVAPESVALRLALQRSALMSPYSRFGPAAIQRKLHSLWRF